MSTQPPPPYGQPPPGQPPYGPPPGQPPYGPPPGQPPYGPPPYGSPPPRRSSSALIAVIVIVALVVAGGAAGGFLLLGGDDDDQASDPPAEETTTGATEETPTGPTEETPAGPTIEGNGYAYSLPEGWNDVTEQALQNDPPGAIDTVAAWGERFQGAPANVIVEVGPAGGASDPEQLRAAWERNMSAATGADPQEIDGRTIADVDAIGVEIRRANPNGTEIVQIAYLALHDDQVYSVGLSANAAGEDDAMAEFEKILGSWSWG